MALIQGGKGDVVSALARESLTLDPDGLIVSPALPLKDDPSGKRVKVRVTALEDYIYTGNDVAIYSRRDLADLPAIFPVLPRCHPEPTLYEMLERFSLGLGILFSEGDLEDAPIVYREDGLFDVQLVAKDLSYSWCGSVLFTFRNLPPISFGVLNDNLSWS